MMLHVLGCGCNKCTHRVEKCPECGDGRVGGQYSCISPYNWFWVVGEYDSMECKFCPFCGHRLEDKGIHPEAEHE